MPSDMSSLRKNSFVVTICLQKYSHRSRTLNTGHSDIHMESHVFRVRVNPNRNPAFHTNVHCPVFSVLDVREIFA